MSQYRKEVPLFKPDNCVEKLATSKQNKNLSRRRFLRDTAIGAAAVGASAVLNDVTSVQAQSQDSGDVTVDAVMLTYIGAPIGSSSTSTYTLSKTRTNTMRMVATRSRSTRIRPQITTPFFTVGGVTFTQGTSSQVTDAITIRNSTTSSIITPAPGVRENTVIFGLREPEIHISGTQSDMLFQFNRSSAEFALTVGELEHDLQTGAGFRPQTIQSFLNQYVTTSSLLVKPRFKLKKDIETGAGVAAPFSQTKVTGSAHSESKTATTSVEITRSFGFRLPFFQATFETTARLEFTMTAVQEMSTDKIISVSTVINRPMRGVTKIYWDRAWKTFTIIDAGPAAQSGQPKLQGSVTDWYGQPVSNAWVYVSQDGVDYMAITDANGNYSLATPSGEPLSTGTWPMTCGDITRNVNIGSGTTVVSFSGVDRQQAQNSNFNDYLLE